MWPFTKKQIAPEISAALKSRAQLCVTCTYAHRVGNSFECRRYPPQVGGSPIIVAPDYYCGEYK